MRSKDQQQMADIKAFIEQYVLENNGIRPSTAMIAKEIGISRAGAYRYLVDMDKLGMIIYRNGTVTTDKISSIHSNLSVAYEESISAGIPDEVEGTACEYFTMPAMFTGNRKGQYFAIKVNGDSMVDAGIDPGDVVICRESKEARNGDIIAAYIRGSGATLKRLKKDREGVYLWAENENWDFKTRKIAREFDVQGVAVRVLKDIDFFEKPKKEEDEE